MDAYSERGLAIGKARNEADSKLAELWIDALAAISYEGAGKHLGLLEERLVIAELFFGWGADSDPSDETLRDLFREAREVRQTRDEAIEAAQERCQLRVEEEGRS